MSDTAEEPRRPMLTKRSVVIISVAFVAAYLAAWGASQGVTALCKLAEKDVDVPSKWPLSLVETRLHAKFPGLLHQWPLEVCITAGVLAGFLVLAWNYRRIVHSVGLVAAAGFVLVLCTNLIHGPWYGLTYPHQGAPQPDQPAVLQYYHDAVKIDSAGKFLGRFQTVQPELECHSRTHPPGAVLLFYALIRTVGHGGAVSVAIAAMSVGLSAVFLYRVLRVDLDRHTCGYVTLLLLLTPAVQIYYCASLDAVVAGFCLGVLAFLRHRNPALSIAGMVGCLFCASWLTFGACFLVPVMVGFEIATGRTVRRSLCVVLGVTALYAVVQVVWDFNYLAAFAVASTLENPAGFMLLADPVSYAMTRLEGVGDILVFFGPFLLVLFVRGLRTMRRGTCPELLKLTVLGVLTLLAMFLTGAFRTGETARACLFIYPYLIFPVAAQLHRHPCGDSQARLLLGLVFGQTLLMQTAAGYYW